MDKLNSKDLEMRGNVRDYSVRETIQAIVDAVHQESAASVDSPEEDREDSKVSAGVALREVENAYEAGKELGDAFVEQASEEVHKAWHARNRHNASNDENGGYKSLSEETKDKDRKYVRAAIRFWREGLPEAK